MIEIIQNIIDTFLAQSWLEIVAVTAAVLYLILVIRENIWCWLFAFISTAIYIYLFYSVVLFSESLLNVYYLVMAVYGWWQWQKKTEAKQIKIHRWQLSAHIKILLTLLVLVPIVGYIMNKLGASFPYLDAFVAMLAVVATYMLTQKVFENWYYWLVVDTLSIYLFWHKQMYLTALLFMLYIILIFIGIKSWKRLMGRQV
ncbi:Predicted thiamin transporter PnuT [hydrothermal vent metagenome]|uniref:Predicted thiamin transporter PnuT n=1 Tax=hydrothermal vent metagenome TaxID=652676 RepID=A0A3B0VKH0_9ZZZZ